MANETSFQEAGASSSRNSRLLNSVTYTIVAMVGLFVIAGGLGFVVPSQRIASEIFLPDIGVMVAIGLLCRWRTTLIIFAAAELIEPLFLSTSNTSAARIALVQLWYSLQGLGVIVLTRWMLGPKPQFTSVPALLKFAFGAVLPLTLVIFGLSGAERLLSHQGAFLQSLMDSIPYTLGILIVAPIAVTAATAPPTPGVRASRWEVAGLFVLLAVVESVIAGQAGVSAQLLLFPCLIAISFRLGTRATAAATAMVCLLAFVGALVGASSAATAAAGGQIFIQLFMVAAVFTALPVAGAIAEQARLRARLVEREAVAQAATARAEQAAAAKSDFLATMSHELRTPLGGILGFAELMRSDASLSPEALRKLSLISESGQSLLMVVNDILDYSKIEAGKIEFDPRPFECGTWALSTVELVRSLADRKGLDLIAAVDDEAAGWFLGDDARLRQVLLNLLNNAVKFTQHGRVSLAIGRAADPASLRFEVSDSGIGISPEGIARLFQRFSQVDNTVSRTYGGTGLGLAICRNIVELMGGRIGVDSQVGEGSTFWFEVPLEATAAVAETRAEAPATACAHVLVVDDMPLNREIARTMLEQAGCRVTEAGGGVEALEAVRRQAFDVVLMDLQMPDLDGLTATRRIRALPDACGVVPIIAMTANVLADQIQDCREAGMNGHVGKPIRRLELIAAVAPFGRATEAASPPTNARQDKAVADGVQKAQATPPLSSPPDAETPDLDLSILEPLMQAAGAAAGQKILESLDLALAEALVNGPPSAALYEAAGREAHGLVGAAGSIGFTPLALAFRRLEYACKHSSPETEEAWLDARRRLGAARDSIAELVKFGRVGARAA